MPLRELRIKEGILVGCIVRRGNVIIPNGNTVISGGDTVIIIIKDTNIYELDDILMVLEDDAEDLVEYYRRRR
jgi:trk system potassium uptake protein TrkA